MPSDVTILLSFFMAMSTPILSTPNTPRPCARSRGSIFRVWHYRESVHLWVFARVKICRTLCDADNIDVCAVGGEEGRREEGGGRREEGEKEEGVREEGGIDEGGGGKDAERKGGREDLEACWGSSDVDQVVCVCVCVCVSDL